jgi:hypothetical protein
MNNQRIIFRSVKFQFIHISFNGITHYKNLCMVRARQLASAAQLVRERNTQGRRNDVKARGADFRERALLNLYN